jgi:hypothetical protein
MDMNSFTFNSKIKTIGAMPQFSPNVVKNEMMFFNSSPKFVYSHDESLTQITREFISQVDTYFVEALGYIPPYVLDSRVHMLMKGWYPCVPGFHHDDVPRSLANKQPNYYNPEYHAEHIMALVNGDVCPTQFALGECTLPDVKDEEMYYKKWHPIVDQLCNDGVLQRYDLQNNSIIKFDAHSFHQGQVARANGWRWFARVSWNTDRVNAVTNEIRRQVNCYLPAPMEGW